MPEIFLTVAWQSTRLSGESSQYFQGAGSSHYVLFARLTGITAHSPNTNLCASVFCTDTPELPPFRESLMELFAEETEVRTWILAPVFLMISAEKENSSLNN